MSETMPRFEGVLLPEHVAVCEAQTDRWNYRPATSGSHRSGTHQRRNTLRRLLRGVG